MTAARVAPLLLTVAEAGELLGYSETHTYRLIAAGEIPTVHLGRRGETRVPRKELERLIEERTEYRTRGAS